MRPSSIKSGIGLFLCSALFILNCSAPVKKASHVVEIRTLKFHPAELNVQIGDTVTWINKDFLPHDVTEEESRKWSSSDMNKDDTWKLVVTESVDYFCSLHPVMKGKLIVE